MENVKRFYSTPKGKASKRKESKKAVEKGKAREWQRNNKDKVREYNRNREQNKKHTIDKNEWAACKNYFNDCCAYCELPQKEHFKYWKGEYKNIDLHREHVIHDGSNDLSNCVPACQSCNSSKSTYRLEEWYCEGNESFEQERLDKINKWLSEDYKIYIKTR